MSTDTEIAILVIGMGLLFIGMITYFIYGLITNTRNFNKFRNNLKVGDKTREGVVTKIDGNDITVERVIQKGWIYPYSEPGDTRSLYRYKEEQ